MEYKVINWSENKFVVNALHKFYSQNKKKNNKSTD